MPYTALYREWRPKTFDDVVGQEHITVTLKNQIKTSRIAHAYLFSGTRGTGKTSTAKILAKAVNCINLNDGEPCNQCEMCKKINSGICIDVIEMDAASKRRLEDIKDVIENVKYPPQEGKYKVYIMDEVHMLTQEAVNAFLKTLEEPPSNVIFILATTDPQKLPVTILSRCQKFDFRRIKSSDVFGRLRDIAKEQGVFADDKSLNLIARMCDGAMRDALSILDQAISMGEGKVDYDGLVNMLGLVTNENLIRLTYGIIDKNVEVAMRIIDDIVFSGKDIYNFIREMITHMRNLLMVKVSQNPEEVLDMSEENINLLKDQSERIRIEEIMRNIRILQDAEDQSKWTKQSRIYLELSVIKMCKIEYDTSKEVMLARLNRLEEALKDGEIKVLSERNIPKVTKNEVVREKQAQNISPKLQEKLKPIVEENFSSKLNLEIVRKSWRDILEAFKSKRYMVLYAALITGKVGKCENGVITIKYSKDYYFNKERLERDDNRRTVEELFSYVLKEKVKINYMIDREETGVEVQSSEQALKNTFGEDMIEIIDE